MRFLLLCNILTRGRTAGACQRLITKQRIQLRFAKIAFMGNSGKPGSFRDRVTTAIDHTEQITKTG